MKKTLFALITIVLLAIGGYLASPLFFDRTVDEEFSYMTDDGRVDIDAVLAMPETVRGEMRDDIMSAAADAPEIAADDEMPSAGPTVLARGSFRDADAVHKGTGQATLYALPNGRHLIRFEDFRTTNGPDLVVYLARHASPESADDVVDNGYLSLGVLKGNVGNQNYEVPPGVDVDEYGSVVIWCELFGVLFSPAPLVRESVDASG